MKIGKRRNISGDFLKFTFRIFELQNKNMAVSQKELEFNFNEDQMRLKISALEQELAKIHPRNQPNK